MTLNDELKRIEKELTSYIEENIDVKDERWHQELIVTRHHLRTTIKILEKNK